MMITTIMSLTDLFVNTAGVLFTTKVLETNQNNP